MKITIFSLGVYPLFKKQKEGFGGAEVQLYLLGNALSKFPDWKVNYVVGDYGNNPKVEQINNITLYKFIYKTYLPDFGKFPVRIFNKAKHKIGYKIPLMNSLFFNLKKSQTDIYLTRCASTLVFGTYSLAKLFGKKFVYMAAHEIDCSTEYEKKVGWRGKLYRHGIQHADLIIVQNDEQKEMIKKHYHKESVMIPSMYPIPGYKERKRTYHLWVGRCEKWKNPLTFIELAKKIPNEQFTMICPPANQDKEYFGIVKVEAEKHPNLKFIRSVEFHNIDEYFQNAKSLINTSTYEGFPNTFIQATLEATPLISMNVNPNNIFETYNLGFFCNNDIEKAVDAIKKLASEEKFQEKSKNAYNYAFENHNIDKNVVKLKTELEKLYG